jgi:hypothetical protein
VLAKYGRSFKGLIVEPGGRIYVEFLGVDGKILREILEIYDVRMLTRFSWLKISYSGGLL